MQPLTKLTLPRAAATPHSFCAANVNAVVRVGSEEVRLPSSERAHCFGNKALHSKVEAA